MTLGHGLDFGDMIICGDLETGQGPVVIDELIVAYFL